MLDFTALKMELLVSMRRTRSQSLVSRKLGFSYNQMHRWEANKTQLRCDDFLRVCGALNVRIDKIFADVFCYVDTPFNFRSFIACLTTEKSPREIAQRLQHSHQTVARWLNDKISPPLELLLQTINTYTSLLPMFCSALAHGKTLPSLEAAVTREAIFRGIESTIPYCEAVRKCLELTSYRRARQHQTGKIAKSLGISLAEEKRALEAMEKHGIIKRQKGKYDVVVDYVEFGNDIVASSKIARYWTERAATRFVSGEPPRTTVRGKNNFSHLTAAVSNDTALKIINRWTECYRDIFNIVKSETGPKERVQVILFHSFDVETVLPSP